jgi:tetratricopeptide (TPR) repeat protein
MKWHSLALSWIFAAGMVVAHPSPGISQTARENSEARKLFNEGVEFQHEGNFLEAEKKFREALRKYPRAEQADRTAFYLIDTLVKLRRVQEARTEIESFRRSYPQSKWQPEVNQSILTLGGMPAAPAESVIWNSPVELRETQALADRLLNVKTPVGPPEKIYDPAFPPNASMKAELLRQIIQRDRERGIQEAKELLKADPSDPAVGANLGTIANSNSPQAVPFLLSVWANTSATPNMRNNAFFWFSRRNPDKEEVAKAITDLLAKRETERVASEALFRMTVADHRAVLEKIVMSSNPEKFVAMEKIYRNGSVLLRTDLLMFVAMLNDPRAVPFIVEAAQNDRDASVRRAAAQALGSRKDVDIETLDRLMKSPPPAARAPQSLRFTPTGGSGAFFIPTVIVPSYPQ